MTMLKRSLRLTSLALTLAGVAVVLPTQPANAAISDVPSGYWAGSAINYVVQRQWMGLYSGSQFRPEYGLRRKQLARALVLAFPAPEPPPVPEPAWSPSPDPSPSTDPSATPDPTDSPEPTVSPSPSPTETPEPKLVFSDVPPTDPSYAFINTAVVRGWMTAPGGAFHPDDFVRKAAFDLDVLRAMGLGDVVQHLREVWTGNTMTRQTVWWAAMVLAGELRFHFNHSSSNERREMGPWTYVSRAAAAYGLQQAANASSGWRVWSMQRYASMRLPGMTASRLAAVRFALQWVGYPYVYGAEWYKPTSSGYCCGAQVVGGFDCSGFSWWVLKAPATGWSPTVVRPYKGWSLPQRTSYDMARATTSRVRFSQLLPMDLMFFKSDLSRTDWPAIDHVGLYLGNGWIIHSSGGRDGVTISWAGDGWWHDHFVWGRHVIP